MKLLNELSILKRLPRLYLVLCFILLAGFAEAFGISVLIPIVTFLVGGSLTDINLGPPFSYIPQLFSALNIPLEVGYVLSMALFFMVLSFFCIHLQDRYVAHSRYELLESIRNEASSNLLLSRWEHLDEVSTGELSNKLMVESDRASESIVSLVNMVSLFVQLSVYILLAILLSWKLSVIALLTILLAAVTSKRLINAVGVLGEKSVKANTIYNKQIVDIFKGSKLVKAFGIEELIKNKLSGYNISTIKVLKKILINQSLMRFELQAFISAALVSILYLAVKFLMVDISILLIFLYIVMRITPKFFGFQGQYYSYIAHKPSLNIIDDLIFSSFKNKELINSNYIHFDGIEECIEFDNVTYSYPNSEANALSNVSFKIKPRNFIAIVGPSGAGKSTILDLCIGLMRPTKGNIKVDGKDLYGLNINSYRKKLGFVSQESIFFDGTIKENLFLNQEFDNNLADKCLEIAQIKDFIKQLPSGLNSQVGEGGSNLSGGQKQRLSIARALIREPSLLILDEATSSLDSRSEALFQQAIESIASEYTLIVIAHRLSTIKKAQKIYVLDEGRLVEEGSYNELVSNKGLFSVLNKTQIIQE
jgi:ABC-type multidrug transport system fused ATPase/permease subunit